MPRDAPGGGRVRPRLAVPAARQVRILIARLVKVYVPVLPRAAYIALRRFFAPRAGGGGVLLCFQGIQRDALPRHRAEGHVARRAHAYPHKAVLRGSGLLELKDCAGYVRRRLHPYGVLRRGLRAGGGAGHGVFQRRPRAYLSDLRRHLRRGILRTFAVFAAYCGGDLRVIFIVSRHSRHQ